MATGVFEIPTQQGEITPGKKIHGVFYNALIVLYSAPEDWCFKQFPSLETLENYALDNHLTVMVKNDE